MSDLVTNYTFNRTHKTIAKVKPFAVHLGKRVSNVSAMSYCLDSFRDLNNKVVYLVNKYLNYTESSIAVVISHRSKIQCLRLYWWWRDRLLQVRIRWTDRFRFYRKIQYAQYQCVWQRYKRYVRVYVLGCINA